MNRSGHRASHDPRRRRRRRQWLAIAAGVVVVSATAAGAATLGTVTPASLGASTAVVAACQASGLGVSWGAPTYTTTGPGYTVAGGTITGVLAACYTKSYRLDVSTGAAVSLANATGTLASAATSTFTLSSATDAGAITQVTLVVYG